MTDKPDSDELVTLTISVRASRLVGLYDYLTSINECEIQEHPSEGAIMLEPMQISGDAIRLWRREHGMSQRDFGKMVGVNMATVGKWESRQANILNHIDLRFVSRAMLEHQERARANKS